MVSPRLPAAAAADRPGSAERRRAAAERDTANRAAGCRHCRQGPCAEPRTVARRAADRPEDRGRARHRRVGSLGGSGWRAGGSGFGIQLCGDSGANRGETGLTDRFARHKLGAFLAERASAFGADARSQDGRCAAYRQSSTKQILLYEKWAQEEDGRKVRGGAP